MGLVYRLGRVTVDTEARKVAVDGGLVPVGSRAFDVLLALVGARGGLVKKQDLLDLVWPGLVVEEANVQVQISALRKAIGRDAIATIPGLGYRLCVLPQFETDALMNGANGANGAPSLLFRDENDRAPSETDSDRTRCAFPLSNSIFEPLPAPPPQLIGREADIQTLCSLLASLSPVSIVGPGGMGKTALALAVAHKLAGEQPVRWINLSAVSTRGDLVATVARTIGLSVGPAEADVQRLARALSGQTLTVVFDNCEHLVDEVAAVIDSISSAAHGVRVLATSQHRLQVSGEHVYRLEPLPVPPAGVSVSDARRYGALLLLERRAQALDRRFTLEEGSLDDVIELSRRLDGLPLAIEIAAARLPTLGVAATLDGLRHRVANLRHPSRGAPERQRTLIAMLDWSCALLGEAERRVLRRLSVFCGSFRLDAAVKVGGGSDGPDDGDVVDAIAGLVDKSLIQVQLTQPPCYRLLETTRSYLASKLDETGETDLVRRSHGAAMVDCGLRAEQSYWNLPARQWRLENLPHYADLQIAFDHAVANGDAAVAGVTGDALQKLDVENNTHAATRRRIDAAHGLVGEAEPLACARLWNCIVTSWLSAAPRSVRRLEAAHARVDSWRAVGDVRQLYSALGLLAVEQARVADWISQAKTSTEMAALENADWPPRLRWEGVWMAAHACEFAGEAASCVDARQRALTIATQAGDDGLIAVSGIGLAEAYLLADDPPAAMALITPLIDRFRVIHDTSHLVWALEIFTNACVLTGDINTARYSAAEMFEIHERRDAMGAAFTTLALFAVASGHPQFAAAMLGFADHWLQAESMRRPPIEVRLVREVEARIDALVGAEERQRQRVAGAFLSTAKAEALVAELLDRASEG